MKPQDLYPQIEQTGQIDWFNEAHASYLYGDYKRCLCAALMSLNEALEAFRIAAVYKEDVYNMDKNPHG